MPHWDKNALDAPHTQREMKMIPQAQPRRITWPVCADCYQHVEPGTVDSHLSWCPYFGYLEFPRLRG